MLYTIRSERQLMEQLDYNILYRWFVGLRLDDPVWDVTVFTKNRERLLAGDIAQAFLRRSWSRRGAQLLSAEHFTVDGTLIEAWAGHKSFNGATPSVRRRTMPATHGGLPRRAPLECHPVSTTDPEALLIAKSGAVKPS